tara:strand:+ start:633 stop:845 length:213 start_codon:yes stop_codon:yes gene_type:complete
MAEERQDVAIITAKDRTGNPNVQRRMTSLRLLPETFDKLDMLSRETGRSRREVIEKLVMMAEVGAYDKGD